MNTLRTQYYELLRNEIISTKELPLKDIAERLNVSEQTAWNMRKRFGVVSAKTKLTRAQKLEGSGNAEKLREMQHLTNVEAAKQLNVSVSTVGKWRRELGLPTKFNRQKPLDELLVSTLIAAQDVPVRELSPQLGVSKATIYNWKKRLGLSTQTRRSKDEFKKLLSESRHLTDKEVAEQLGLTTSYVHKTRKELNIQGRPSTSMERLIASGKLQKIIDTRNLSCEKAEKETGIGRGTILRWRQRLGISNPKGFRSNPNI